MAVGREPLSALSQGCTLTPDHRLCSWQGRVFMTHPTKAIYHSLLKDFARGGKGSADEAL